MNTLKNDLEKRAEELGLCFLHIAPADIQFSETPITYTKNRGYFAEMKWLSEHIHTRLNPKNIGSFAQSIIVCGLHYYQPATQQRGAIAMHALGRDYHKVLRKKMEQLAAYITELGYETRCAVDSAPILEKPIAVKAGAGWIGKSSLLVSAQHGTLFFLGEIFTSLVLPYGTAQKNQCGSCTACIDACPTEAIMPDGYVDARKCISYLTIEHAGTIPLTLRSKIGNRLYGCDECSVSCVYNSFEKITQEKDFTPRSYPDVAEILHLTPEEFTKIFAGSSIHRIGVERLQRNACVVLGNIGTTVEIPVLQKVCDADNPLLQEHAQWAIEEILRRNK
jgi:epoxyqueuosine reductase